MQVLTNLSGRNFAPRVEAYCGVDAWDCDVADFDGDGLDDIAVADTRSSDDGRVNLFRSLGAGA